jgi:hypothetical protein
MPYLSLSQPSRGGLDAFMAQPHCSQHGAHSTLRQMTRIHSWRIKRRGVNNVRSTLFSMPTAKLTGEERSGKCRVKSPEGRIQSRSPLRTPHFIVLGIWRGFDIKCMRIFERMQANGIAIQNLILSAERCQLMRQENGN